MPVPTNYRGMVNYYNELPDEVRDYFGHFQDLTEKFPWDIVIAYLYSRVELAQNMTVYCGVVKLHRVDSVLARKAVDGQHMTRKGFKEMFQSIFAKKISDSVAARLDHAEKIRDRILHGKDVTEAEKRQADHDILRYAVSFNRLVYDVAGFRPFGPLKGFKGAGQALDKSTSRWVLRGIGFTEFQ